MSREKQIEEMAKIIASSCYKSCSECNSEAIDGTACIEVRSAEALYDAGYRKQSEGEWIEEYNPAKDIYEHRNFAVCSLCSWKQLRETNFCPGCGAKMKGA